MDVEIISIGGYEEVGKNMTAVKVGKDIVIFDMGIHLDRVHIHEDTNLARMHSLELINRGVIPDDTIMRNVDGNVRAIVFTHGHLDHIGAVTKLAEKYNAPIISTPYTLGLIERMLKSEKKFNVLKRLQVLKGGEKCQISSNIILEFIHVTHSIPHSVIAVLHTPVGAIVYALDFKFDNHQIISPPPQYSRLRKLGKENVFALIVESTRVGEVCEVKTHSERIARFVLEDIMKNLLDEKVGIIITTFSSHIERIQAIADIVEENSNRHMLILGRSMERYCSIAENMELLKLPENASIYGNPKAVSQALARATANKEDYVLITTGHQGEPDALLPRIANSKTPYKIQKTDNIIISAPVIPHPVNTANRYLMEKRLQARGARIFTDVHVSGHAGREDHRDLIRMLNPMHIIPAHGDLQMLSAYAELAEEEGYNLGEDIHLLRNGQAQVFEGGQ